MIQDMINSETIWIQPNRQTQTYSEYCNQCLADKTDHLEWEVCNVALTILKGKLVALDYHIPIGHL